MHGAEVKASLHTSYASQSHLDTICSHDFIADSIHPSSPMALRAAQVGLAWLRLGTRQRATMQTYDVYVLRSDALLLRITRYTSDFSYISNSNRRTDRRVGYSRVPIASTELCAGFIHVDTV